MTKDNILCTCALDHLGRHFAGVGSFFLVGTIFCAKADDILIEQLCHTGQMDERSADDHIAVGLLAGQSLIQFFGECHTFLQVHVHFPVSCYNFLSHFLFPF